MPSRWLLCLAFAFSLASAAQPGPPQLVLHGTVMTQSGEHPALFTLLCTTGKGGALSLQLAVVRDTAPDFPFDAFAGPNAPASHLPSAALRVGEQTFPPVPVSGWIGGDGPDMFVFGIAATLGKRNIVTDFAGELGKPGVTISWVQSANNVQTPPLAAQFIPDAEQSHALQRIAAPCLPRRRS